MVPDCPHAGPGQLQRRPTPACHLHQPFVPCAHLCCPAATVDEEEGGGASAGGADEKFEHSELLLYKALVLEEGEAVLALLLGAIDENLLCVPSWVYKALVLEEGERLCFYVSDLPGSCWRKRCQRHRGACRHAVAAHFAAPRCCAVFVLTLLLLLFPTVRCRRHV